MSRQLHHAVAAAIFRRYSLRLDQLNYNAALARWLRSHHMKLFPSRHALHHYVSEFIGNGPLDYLEFGVYQGESIKMWTELNRNERSRFFGFDSFEGLPEAWGRAMKRGAFDVGGALPQIDDPRVHFVKGWFNETLSQFMATFTLKSRLVIHNDSDLYSSTLYLLTKLDPIVKPGSILIFDEFYSSLHEFRAFQDYVSAYKRELRPIGRSEDVFGRIAFVFD